MINMERDEFEEFDTPAEEILTTIRSGAPVTFGVRMHVEMSTIPGHEPQHEPQTVVHGFVRDLEVTGSALAR